MSERNGKHVVIVGFGFTGTTTLHQLVRKQGVSKITVVQSELPFGPGFPYQPTESDEFLINNTNDTMCLDPGNRRAFFEWLQRKDRYATGLDPKGHMPRVVYGEFLMDSLSQSLSVAADRGIEVVLVKRECIDIEEHSDDGLTVFWTDGSTIADMAILATGRCPDVDVFGLDDHAGENYFPTHMPGTRLDNIPLDAEAHVIGASLSAYDVVNQLFAANSGCEFVPESENRLRYVANDNQRRVVLCSRSGRLKKMQTRNPFPVERHHFTADAFRDVAQRSATLEQMFELMRNDAADNGVDIDFEQLANPYAGCTTSAELNNRATTILRGDIDNAASSTPGENFVVDYLDHAQFDIWDIFAAQKLTVAEEQRYRSHFESAFLSVAAPCPVPTAQKILALLEADRLRIVHGMKSLVAHPDGSSFEIGHAFGTELSHYVVNATGAVDRNVRSCRQSPLISSLVRRRLLRPYAPGGQESPGAAVDMQTFRCTGSRHIYAANMFLWGPGFFTSAAIIMATVVERLLGAAFPD